MMRTLQLLSILAVLGCQIGGTLSFPEVNDYCLSKEIERPQQKHYSSHGVYDFVKGTNFEEDLKVPNCKPVKLYILSRHGTRLPKVDQIESLPELDDIRDEIKSNYQKPVENGLCPEDLDLIFNWSFDRNITVDKKQFLTVQGWNEMRDLAKYYQKVFPEFPVLSNYDEKKILLRHVSTQVSEGSFKAFVEGLYGENAHEWVKKSGPPPVGVDDTLLRAAKTCPEWLEREDDNKGDDTEAGKFKKSDVMLQTLAKISNRLGYSKPQKYKKIKLMWHMCRFETAWFPQQTSPWCTVFRYDDILVFEYLDDLAKQYSSGYSTDLNPTIPCEAVQDLFARLNSDDDPQVIFYISNSALIQLLATALGTQKDDQLLTSDGFYASGKRKWRTSELDPFAANYVVVKYDCSADSVDPSTKIKFFANQKLIEVAGCEGGFCRLADITAKHQNYINADCSKVACTHTKI